MLELLLEHGAGIDYAIGSTEGLTFLMYFCGMETELTAAQGQVLLETVSFLLEHGADRMKKNLNDKTAFDLAQKNPQKNKVLSLLRTVKQKYSHEKQNSLRKIISVDLKEVEMPSKTDPSKECGCLIL
eukprot:TRINITY_DN1989_c0_g3_i2.p1 TRINITY_DN1989_c0_g3~~TRINITY_DN1989_c0_g3_i2.p1  ORF type:complete len:128 (-),score=36.44 TRINITY_DN1989_c0_g3_i2:164-547(-)